MPENNEVKHSNALDSHTNDVARALEETVKVGHHPSVSNPKNVTEIESESSDVPHEDEQVGEPDQDDEFEYELEETEEDDEEIQTDSEHPAQRKRKKRRRRLVRHDAAEIRLLGRKALCKSIADIAPHMLKTVKLRILGRFLDSKRGLNEAEIDTYIRKESKHISSEKRILEQIAKVDPDVNRRNLKEIIIFTILLQEETHSLEENRLADKVIEYEKNLVKQSKKLDFFDPKAHDAMRCHNYDTYRIVLDAAWRSEDDVSQDEAQLLKVLRGRLHISREEHRLIGCFIKRFPKNNCHLHTHDEIHDARKELQRESILWSYRDENNKNIDIIPREIVEVLRNRVADLELQRTNYRRILQNDSIRVSDLKEILISREMDRYGNKAELIARLVESNILPSQVLDELDRSKLSEMCRMVGLKSSGSKAELSERLIGFYDDLTFVERSTKDEREVWYNNYELLATRSYSDLKAKKLIGRDLEIEHQFEKATDFLFEMKLHLEIDRRSKVSKADGRIPLANNQVILWDCKSGEKEINLQDHLEDQFDGYLRKEREKGNQPLAFLVIGPSFTSQSIKIALKYKATTNWDIGLIEADALKYLADQWDATEPSKPFPIRLFNRTDLVDKEMVEFLLSLA